MNLSAEQKRVIQSVVNVFETGKPEGDYGAIATYHDGPHNIRQITYGRSQTTEYGNLRKLVEMYIDSNGIFIDELRPFADDIGSRPLTDDTTFKTLLRRSGREDPLMRSVQNDFFDQAYFLPAIAWADQRAFQEALSALVIYDSFIHSGSILWVIRMRFSENPPSEGGDEKTWISQYIDARQTWLAGHPRAAVRATTYRTACFRGEVDRSNWDLQQLPIMANGIDVK